MRGETKLSRLYCCQISALVGYGVTFEKARYFFFFTESAGRIGAWRSSGRRACARMMRRRTRRKRRRRRRRREEASPVREEEEAAVAAEAESPPAPGGRRPPGRGSCTGPAWLKVCGRSPTAAGFPPPRTSSKNFVGRGGEGGLLDRGTLCGEMRAK